jgi:hypothetical protein
LRCVVGKKACCGPSHLFAATPSKRISTAPSSEKLGVSKSLQKTKVTIHNDQCISYEVNLPSGRQDIQIDMLVSRKAPI